MFAGSVALINLGLQPLFLGSMSSDHAISLGGVGLVAMGEIVALGLGSALSEALLPIARYRLIAAAAAIVTAAVDVVTPLASGDLALTGVRVGAGLAEGVLLWTAVSIIVRAKRPSRTAALFMAVQTFSQLAAALSAPFFMPAAGGWKALFAALGGLSLVTALAAAGLPARLAPLAPESAKKGGFRISHAAPLAAAFLQFGAIGAFWAYLEPIGAGLGLDERTTAFTVSLVLAMQVIGAGVASRLIERVALLATLVFGGALLAGAAGAVFLLPRGQVLGFEASSAAFGFLWLFLAPFFVAFALRVDAAGRVALLVPAAQLLGSAAGPLVASLVVGEHDAGAALKVSLAFEGAALVLIMIFAAFTRGRAGKSAGEAKAA
jgi:hypothetical protein